MLFSSITFLYYFLPITMLIYFVVPKNWRNAILFLASFLFYFWGEPKYSILITVSILTGYLGGYAIDKVRSHGNEKLAKIAMISSVAVLLGFLAVFKYADFVIATVNGFAGSDIPLVRLALPIGISFYTFQIECRHY